MYEVATSVPEIPLVDLRAQYAPLHGEILEALAAVLEGMELFQGPQLEAFEKEFAAFCGCREAVGLSSGTDALELALRAVGVQAGDEVITQPNTFIATAEAICAVGALPVFVDVDPLTGSLAPGTLESHMTSRTRAVVPVHLYGRPADMVAIRHICHPRGVAIIEDACQAHGARIGNQRVGVLGDLACFSFYSSKNLGAYGEAGIVTTNNAALADRVRLYRNHGSRQRYIHEVIGRNARMDEMQAAILRIKLQYLHEWNERRRERAHRLSEALAGMQLQLPPPDEDAMYQVFHLYVVRHPERDRLRTFLASRGIATGIHYPLPIHLQPAYSWLGWNTGSFPEAERWSEECLSLPMYAELSESQIARIAAAVREFVTARA